MLNIRAVAMVISCGAARIVIVSAKYQAKNRYWGMCKEEGLAARLVNDKTEVDSPTNTVCLMEGSKRQLVGWAPGGMITKATSFALSRVYQDEALECGCRQSIQRNAVSRRIFSVVGDSNREPRKSERLQRSAAVSMPENSLESWALGGRDGTDVPLMKRSEESCACGYLEGHGRKSWWCRKWCLILMSECHRVYDTNFL